MLKKKISLIVVGFMLLLSSAVSANPSGSVEIGSTTKDNVVYLNGQPVQSGDIIYANESNQQELIEKYDLQKPSENSKLVSIRVISSPNEITNENPNPENAAPFGVFGFRFEKNTPQMIDGWTEIARGKYFCNRPSTQTCSPVQVEVQASQAVSTEISTSFGVSFNDVISAEFGYSVGETIQVSTTVIPTSPTLKGGQTYIAVGYPIYKSTFFKLYEKGLFSETLLGTGSFMVPQPSSIAVTDWVQG